MSAARSKNPYKYPAHQRNSKPKNNRCYKCGKAILSATHDALPIHLDPQALTTLGEISALVGGVKTWFISNENVFYRNAWSIRTSPTGLGGDIVQEHRCDRPQPSGVCARPVLGEISDDPGF